MSKKSSSQCNICNDWTPETGCEHTDGEGKFYPSDISYLSTAPVVIEANQPIWHRFLVKSSDVLRIQEYLINDWQFENIMVLKSATHGKDYLYVQSNLYRAQFLMCCMQDFIVENWVKEN